MKAKAHWNSPNVKSMQVFYGHLCLSEVICMYVYGILKTNTNMKFHTCDVVVGSRGCVMYIRGWVSYLAHIRVSLFIYFIFIYITASPLRSVILRTLLIFSLRLAWFFCTSEIECNSSHKLWLTLCWITGCQYLWNDVKYLFTHQLSCVQPNLFCIIILDLYHVEWNKW